MSTIDDSLDDQRANFESSCLSRRYSPVVSSFTVVCRTGILIQSKVYFTSVTAVNKTGSLIEYPQHRSDYQENIV